MDTIDLSFSISYNINFSDIPEGAEEYAETIRSNIEMVVNSRIGEYIGDSFDSFDEGMLEKMIDNIAQTELAVSSSSAQSEREQNLYAALSFGCYVTVTMSRSAKDLKQGIVEYITQKIQSQFGDD